MSLPSQGPNPLVTVGSRCASARGSPPQALQLHSTPVTFAADPTTD